MRTRGVLSLVAVIEPHTRAADGFRVRSALTLVLGLTLAACSDPPTVGSPCTDGGQCTDELLCFVAVDGEPGECDDFPPECDEFPQCHEGCFDTYILEQCGALGGSCISVQGRATITCNGA
jgi:hypothetical protein